MVSGATEKAGGALSKNVALALPGTPMPKATNIMTASTRRKMPIPRTLLTEMIRPSGARTSAPVRASGGGASPTTLTLPIPS